MNAVRCLPVLYQDIFKEVESIVSDEGKCKFGNWNNVTSWFLPEFFSPQKFQITSIF